MAVNATAVWRVRPLGANTNGGGFDTGIAGYGTDYSQQDAAQAAFPVVTLGLTTSAAGATTLTDSDARGLFTAAMVGNAIHITAGTNFTTGVYFVVTYTDPNNVVLDRTPTASAAGTVGAANLGGGWGGSAANAMTVNLASTGPIVAGNTAYVLGGASPSYASPDYTCSVVFQSPNGSVTVGMIIIAADPLTPSGNGWGGRVLVKVPGSFHSSNSNYVGWNNFFFVATSSSIYPTLNGTYGKIYNCILDQAGHDVSFCRNSIHVRGCLVFSSAAKIGTNAQYAISTPSSGRVEFCNVYGPIGPGISLALGASVNNAIIANCGEFGLVLTGGYNLNYANSIKNCTFDNNASGGVSVTTSTILASLVMENNIFTNHAAGAAIDVSAGTTAVNDAVKLSICNNTFWNNLADLTGISYGTNDTSNTGTAPNTISSSPVVDAATGNYTLA